MFCESLLKKCTSEEILVLVSNFNRANVSIKLERPIHRYTKKATVAFIVLMLTVLDLNELIFYEDESRTFSLANKLYFLQKQVQSCYILESNIPTATITADEVNEIDDESVINEEGSESAFQDIPQLSNPLEVDVPVDEDPLLLN